MSLTILAFWLVAFALGCIVGGFIVRRIGRTDIGNLVSNISALESECDLPLESDDEFIVADIASRWGVTKTHVHVPSRHTGTRCDPSVRRRRS